ncbi:MAG TPA: biotin-dependent carboxyltransferase family protein, partial [Rhodocyclaceae bacterium]|nr:biotin-dependent carboxyltransferase family protein [Rhodocyclaceae bacterium]
GDEVPAAAAVAARERVLKAPPSWGGDARTPIRVVLGPQADYFDDDAIARFLAEPWIVSAAADRMGVRLEGARPLAHRADKGTEIVSDATVPGSIQVPGAGQPIVLLADAQTAGGYPKIATVVSADLPRLAARRPGATIHFAAVDAAAAERLSRARARELDRLLAGIAVLAGEGVDLDALYRSNLVDGVVNALQPDEFPRG